MKIDDLRPEELAAENLRLERNDAEALFAEADTFVSINCPACDSSSRQPAFTKYSYSFVKCDRCSTVYVNPRPSPEMLARFYSGSAARHWSQVMFPASEAARRSQVFAPRLERVIELCERHGTSVEMLIDVGAGNGTFCDVAIESGKFGRVMAVEPSAEAAEVCRSKGIPVLESLIENAGIGDASIVTCFELIEHLFSPLDVLKQCYAALAENGLLVITTPNMEGFDLALMGPVSDNVTAPSHINYFNPRSIGTLLDRAGFELLEISTPGKLDAEIVRKSALAGEIDISSDPLLRAVLIDQWEELGASFQRFLSKNKLSSHMWAVAIKR